jgi:hypothetical protein
VRLTPVAIGVDEDGDPVTSCVVDGMEIVPERPQPKFKETTDLVWAAICERSPNNAPITFDDLRKYCGEFLPKGGANAGRALTKALNDLKGTGLIQETELNTYIRVME